MAKSKKKSNVPDLSKEDPGTDAKEEVKTVKTDEKPSEAGMAKEDSKPRYVTVERSDDTEKPQVEEKPEPKEQKEEKPIAPEPKPETKLEPPSADVKVTPSFSLLDADKKTEAEPKPKETKNAPEVKKEPPAIKLSTTPITPPEETTEEDKKDDGKSEDTGKEVKKWLSDTPITEDSGIEESSGIGKKIILFVFILMVIAGVVGGGFYYYKNNMASDSQSNENEGGQIVVHDANDVTPTPTPESEEEVDLTEFTISVLNGSGVPGEAGKASDLLTEAGFSEADTGNAESYDYGSTQVSMKESVPESVFDNVSEALSVSYDVSSVPAELDEDSTYDIIVIVGADEPEPEPTATPTPEELEEE